MQLPIDIIKSKGFEDAPRIKWFRVLKRGDERIYIMPFVNHYWYKKERFDSSTFDKLIEKL